MTTIINGSSPSITFSDSTTQSSGIATTAGVVGVTSGGTGASTLTANNVILGNGTSAVQLVAPSTSGNVLTSNGTTWSSTAPASLGVGQTWGDRTGNRSLGVTYTNSTGKPIGVAWQSTSGYNPTVVVDGVTIVTATSYLVFVFFVVPNGSTYSISTSNSYLWCELR